MTQCEKYEMFINDHPEITFKYMVWEDKILPLQITKENGPADFTDVDFDIVD